MKEVILQVWQESSGNYAGRILREGVEDGRVADCRSKNDVECQAIDAGIEYDRLEVIDQAPPYQSTELFVQQKSLETKIALFDPVLHGGDITESVVPVGREFGTKVRR